MDRLTGVVFSRASGLSQSSNREPVRPGLLSAVGTNGLLVLKNGLWCLSSYCGLNVFGGFAILVPWTGQLM
jgi:hypothetical protein